jgi:hypothetical protein
MTLKIALCGPPQSGKSVLRERLKAELSRLTPTVYPYVLTTNPRRMVPASLRPGPGAGPHTQTLR